MKLWDLRSFGPNNLLYTYKYHNFTPESVRFVDIDLIASASKDQSIHLIDLEGNQVDSIKHYESFSCMTPLESSSNFIVTADVKSNVMIYAIDKAERQIKVFE